MTTAIEDEAMRQPYRGLKVLDLSQGFAGPYTGALLAMQGATVTKVEPPAGDWIREIGAGQDGITAWTVIANAGKRSACIDASTPGGRALLERMAAHCDVLIQNFRPGVIERMGLSYEKLAVKNPALIFVSITGFGERGPDSRKAGSDSVLQAYTGMASVNRLPDGCPRRIPFLLPDTVTALYAAQSVGAALYTRAVGGRGRHVKISLMESCAALQTASVLDDFLSDGKPAPPATVPAGIFRTSDGFMTVTSMSDAMFASLLRVIGLEEWVSDPRFATIEGRQKNSQTINDELASRLARKTTAAWVQAFTDADVLCSPVHDYRTFRDVPQVRQMRVFEEVLQHPYGTVPIARVPGGSVHWPVGAAPVKGQHTDEILAELGIDRSECEKLEQSRVIFQAPKPGASSRCAEA